MYYTVWVWLSVLEHEVRAMKPPKVLYIVIQYEIDGELSGERNYRKRAKPIIDDPIVILDKKRAQIYADHTDCMLVAVPWSKIDGQYGRGSVLRVPKRKA